jgi:arsenate reductase
MEPKKRVLILCTGNSARSQMAEGILRSIAGDRFDVASAGVAPSRVRPEAVEAMRDIGVDISTHRSKSVDEFLEEPFDYVITVCDNAKESCPVFPGNAERIHWSFDDPAAYEGTDDEKLSEFIRVRDQIFEKLRIFFERFSDLTHT